MQISENSVVSFHYTLTDSTGKVITVHGFRSTFRDWAGETTAYPREVIEHPEVTKALRIPMMPHLRSLNLANAAAIAVYEAWRQLGHPGAAT